ncbi:MAG: hypothetical protein ACREBQ_02700, partial [Nitrososphaerales archaeon]
PIAIAIILRLYPYFLSGVPWGTDAWPLIRNTNEMLANSPTSLGGNPIFDSYNIYWPGVSLFGASGSLIFGTPALTVMPIIIPLVASLSTLFFFLIVEKLSKNSIVACIASLFFATAGFDAIFTASATKETFAYPLFMVAVLLLLMKPDAKNMSLFVIISVALALSHHVTMIILLAIAGGVVFSNAAFSLGGYGKFGKTWLLPLIAGVIFVAYVELYARIFLTGVATAFVVSINSLIPLLALFFVSMVVATYFSLASRVRSMIVEGLVLLGASLALLFLSTQRSILPFAPTLPGLIAVLALPYLLVGFFGVFGYKAMHDSEDKAPFAFTSSWLAATLALLAYSIIGTPNGVFLIYRFFSFVYAPVAIFGALGIAMLLRGGRKGAFKIARTAAIVALIIGIVFASSYMSFASVVGRENLLAGHYAYTRSDFESAQFVNSTLPSNSTLAADNMIADLYTDYFLIGVNVNQGYRYLSGLDQLGASSSEMLVTYSMLSTQGYDLNIYGIPIPANWYASLSNQSSLVFNNGNEMIWR